MNVLEMKKQYDAKLPIFLKMENYYKGVTDANLNYKQNSGRSNLKVSCNYVKKFVKEETSYSVGNPIAYSSKSDDENVQKELDRVQESFKENHDVNVFNNMVLYSIGYEVYFIDRWGDIQVKAITPCNGYHTEDGEGNVTSFIHVFNKVNEEGETEEFIDLYTPTGIEHYNKEGKSVAITRYVSEDGQVKEVKETITPHFFGEVPVGVAKLSDYGHFDTIFNDIKGLQDAVETNLSDITNEVSDFRSAYLVMKGLSLGTEEAEREENAAAMKELGIFEVDAEGSIEWLIKNINDTFVQNTLKTLCEKMYELTSHINHNDSESVSNASGVALKSRLISLMQRCTINQNSYKELLKTRIRIIFTIANKLGANLNWKDVKITFTANIPSDDNQVADMISKLDGIVSKSTLRTLLSFVENEQEEEDKVSAELKDTYGTEEFTNTSNIIE